MPAVDTVTAPMVLTAPVDQDLLFKSMSATEELGRLFEFEIEALSPSPDITPEDLLGKPVSVALELDAEQTRYFHGRVCAMGTSGTESRMFGYRLILRPWLWLMTRRTDTRIFQDLSVVDILKKVFEPFEPDYHFDLQGTFPKYDYCVQYRETDFNFASRLMEQEGIYYYFTHTADKHTMVLVNSPSAHEPNPWQETFQFRDSIDGQLEFEAVTQWQTTKEIQSGKVVLRDYDFESPALDLQVQAAATRPKASELLEHYDYPGNYVKKPGGDRYSKLRIEELQARYSRVHGSGALRGMACGTRFALKSHPRADQNREHLVLSTRMQMAYSGYEAGPDRTYCQCQFTAMDGDELYRPERITPKPLVAGVHTAVVVGPAGDEIHTDAHGRVKVQFHWDRLGKKDAKSSCWVRVSSPWAGQNWGMISLPRIGQEVIVDFLEGDPDRPIVTGSVYNGEQMPPYGLPGSGMVSGFKSASTPGGGGYNEISANDTKGKEKVTIHAQYDMSTTVQHDDTQTIVNDRTITVTGKHTETIKKDTSITVSEGNYTHTVGKGNSLVKVDTGTHTHNVKGLVTETFLDAQKTDVTKDVTITSSTGKIKLDGKTEIVLVSGASSITLKADGTITISGKKIEITGGDEAKMGVGNQSVTCDKTKVGVAGAAINSSAVGMHEIAGALVKIN